MTEPDKTLWLDHALDVAHEALQGDADGMIRVETAVIARALLRLNNRVESLYGVIAHGDEEHRRWLRAKLDEHFGIADKREAP